MFESITLFGLKIPTYAFCMCLGMLLAALVACRLVKRRNHIKIRDLIVSAVYTVVGAMLGAKLLYIAVSWDDILRVIDRMEYQLAESIWYVLDNGFVFYGGLIGGFFALCLYICQFKRRALDYFTVYAVVLPLGHALGRIGCFAAGCCYGMQYDGVFSVDFPIYPGVADSPVVARLPVQLFEAAALLLLFALLAVLYYRFPKKPTLPLWTYLAVYPILRFALEFWRGDEARGGFWLFSTSQWISIGILLVAGIAFYFTRVKKKAEK